MRIALIADTHGHLDEQIVAAIAGCDRIVHAGDVGRGVIEALEALGRPLTVIRGNNDPGDVPWPEAAELDLPGGMLTVVHGHQWPAKNRHARLRAAYPEARAVVCGHSHRQVVDRDEKPWVLNPGAAGRTRTYGGPAGLILTAGERQWRVRVLRFSLPSR